MIQTLSFSAVLIGCLSASAGVQFECPPKDAPIYNPGLLHPLNVSRDKQIDQIIFMGAHNAGANRKVRGLPEKLTCWARNQEVSFYGMLQLGVRYLDLDICYRNKVLRFCHTKKQISVLKGPYFGKVEQLFVELSCFVKQHPQEVIFIHFNRDYIAFGRAANRPKMVNELYGMFEKYKDIIFPLGQFRRQKARYPTVGEVQESRKPVQIFITKGMDRLAGDVDKETRELPVITEKDLQIIYLAYSISKKGGEWKVSDKKLKYIRETCRDSDEQFIDFQVIGRPSSLRICNPTMALASNSIAFDALEACRKERCKASKGQIGINFLTLDYVNYGPEDLYDYYNFGRCDLPNDKNGTIIANEKTKTG